MGRVKAATSVTALVALSCGEPRPATPVVAKPIVGSPTSASASASPPRSRPPEPPASAKPEPPPAEPVNPELDAEGWWLLGTNDTHAWLSSLATNDPQPGYSVVLDQSTGCAVESYKDAPVFGEIAELLRPIYAETYMGAPSPSDGTLNDGIRKSVGLASRFGMTSLHHNTVAWNAEGPYVLVRAGLLYRSADGGRTFHSVDKHPADEVAVTPDGKTAVYERCHDLQAVTGRPVCRSFRELVSLPLDGSREPLVLSVLGISSRNQGLSKDGHALVWTTDSSGGCLQFVDPKTAAVDRKVCVTDPHFAKPPSSAPQAQTVSFSGLSPDEKYAVLHWQGFTQTHLTYETAVVDMTAAKIVRVLPEWQMRGIDDAGTVLAGPWAEGSGDAIYRFPLGQPKKLLFRGAMLEWEPKRHRAIVEVATARVRKKLGKVSCKIVRVETTP
jgi:hypothetical protein